MLRLLAVVVLIYLAFVAFMWMFQHRLLYLPEVGGREIEATPADVGLAYEDLDLVTDDGVRLHGWFVPAAPERAAILFFHGNAGNISHRLDTLRMFHELGLSVLLLDYRGFGRSEGRPSESGTALDARAAWDWLLEDAARSAGDIVIAGRSLGSAVAAELARTQRPGAVILESPFRSVPILAQEVYPFLPARWLARFHYPTEEYVAAIDAPVFIIHSRDDEIIPFAHGEAVHAAANEPKSLLPIRGGHNTGFIESRQRYLPGIDGFLDGSGFPAR
jgi:uncharacterized protein